MNNDRASLLAGLRTAGMRGHQPSPDYQDQQQHQQQLQQLQHQQMLQYQQYQQHLQQQQQHQQFHQHQQQIPGPQAQLYAMQQAQLELQLQQLQMANLAIHEQLVQHQTLKAQQQQRQQQQQQQAQDRQLYSQSQLPPLQVHKRNTSNSQSSQQRLPAAMSPSMQQQNWRKPSQGPEDSSQRAGALRNLSQGRRREVSGSGSSSVPASNVGAAPSNLDWQAERLKYNPSSSAEIVDTSSDAPLARDSQSSYTAAMQNGENGAIDLTSQPPLPQIQTHHRKQSSVASTASTQSVSTLSEAGWQYSPNQGPALILSKPVDEYPEETDDETGPSADDVKESYFSGTGDERQDNKGPPTHRDASESASSEHGGEFVKQAKKKSKSKRHTVILSSSLPRIITPPLSDQMPKSESMESLGSEPTVSSITIHDESSSAASTSGSSSGSPTTSERSEIASYNSANSSSATSAALTSPAMTVTNIKDEVNTATAPLRELSAQSAEDLPIEAPAHSSAGLPAEPASAPSEAVTGSQSPRNLNPAAASFAPSSTPRYPASLSPSDDSAASSPGPSSNPLPFRMFSAPLGSAGSTFPGSSPGAGMVTVIRQPKGPADEKDLKAKNFASLIRRRAIGALRIASTKNSNGGIGLGRPGAAALQPHIFSPTAPSPVTGHFLMHPTPSTQQQPHLRSVTSPPLGVMGSPDQSASALPGSTSRASGPSSFAAFGNELAQRALKRRSQQLALGVGAPPASSHSNVGLGMY